MSGKKKLGDSEIGDALKKIRMFGFDLEGTLTQYDTSPRPSGWALIAKELGCEKEDDLLNKEYYAGKFDISTWARKTTEIYKEHKLTKERFRDIFMKHMKLAKNTEELFERLSARGVKTAIVSGSMVDVYKVFVEKFGVKAEYTSFAHRLTFDRQGMVTGGVFTNFDYELKTKAFEGCCSAAGVSIKDCAYAGDELNDLHIFGEVGLPIAVNATKQEVRDACMVVLDKPDFSYLLQYI